MSGGWVRLGFYGAAGHGFDGDAFSGEELHGLVEGFVVGRFELEDDLADLRGDAGAADVEHHVDGLGHLMDDRFFDQVGRVNQFKLSFNHKASIARLRRLPG